MKRREGWVLMDNTASGGQRVEYASYTCNHCNRAIIKNPKRVRPRNYCAKCDATICDLAGCNVECNPTLQMVELSLQYPGEPFLYRNPGGIPIFNTDLRDKERIY